MDLIRLKDITVFPRLGVGDLEKAWVQKVTLDVELSLDLSVAARSDRIEDTIDYRTMIETAKRIIGGESVHLLETLAERIATDLLNMRGVQKVRIRVTKLRPPIPDFDGTVAVEIERSDSEQ